MSETEVFEAQDDLVYINDTVPGTTRERGRDARGKQYCYHARWREL